MYDYEHSQPGTLIRVLLGIFGVAFCTPAAVNLASGVETETAIVFIVVAVMCASIVALFHSLTVRVSRNDISLSFGIGLIRKRFLIDEIKSATIVRNRWYNGWGIRKIWGGWLYNVSGFDAVEIQLKNDRKYRIGTDQPCELLAAVESASGISK
jgi:uncharacterized membrane protein YeaQ/YmgE (transglycosylase-associated protein family)